MSQALFSERNRSVFYPMSWLDPEVFIAVSRSYRDLRRTTGFGGTCRVAEKKGYCGGERFFDFFFLKNEYIGIERII